MANLPKNAHVSQHPCLQAKLSQLRSASTSSKEVQSLVHDIALMVGYEALAQGLQAQNEGTVCIPTCSLRGFGPHSCRLTITAQPHLQKLYLDTHASRNIKR